MEEYPNWEQNTSAGSDLPRPRKKPVSGSVAEPKPEPSAPAASVTPVKPPVSAKPAAPVTPVTPVQKPQQEADPAKAEKKNYGKDTMQFRTPLWDTEFDTEFERRRAAPLPARSSHPKAAEPPKRPIPQHAVQKKTPAQPKPERPPQKAPVRKKKTRLSPLGRFVRALVVLVTSVYLVYTCAALFLISRLERVPREGRSVTDGALDASHVTSILLIGTDARDTSERGRSDSMILLSINSKSEKIYLSSFMRDAYVEIPGHGSDKLNAAYSYGGQELLMDTLELNYGVSVDDCMIVSFSGFAGVIDAFGGVEITMSDSEARALNEILISEVNELMGDARDADLLDGGGTFRLNGKQALSYSRIRYVGNADFERTSRQREVMTQLFSNLKSGLVTAVPELVQSALPHVGTNMSTGEMYLLSLKAPFVLGYDIEQLQIPAEGTWSGQTVDGQSVLVVDFDENMRLLQETVYAAGTS